VLQQSAQEGCTRDPNLIVHPNRLTGNLRARAFAKDRGHHKTANRLCRPLAAKDSHFASLRKAVH
jgi:hypothetical protein